MPNVSGYIESVQERPSQYKWPDGKQKPSMWSIKVDNVNYGAGNKKPPAQGSYVTFETVQKENGYYNVVGDVSLATPPVGTPAPSQAVPAMNGAPAAVHVDRRQDSIVFQSSRKDALEFVKLLFTNNLIDLGKAKGAQKIELAEVYLDYYTERFIDNVTNLAVPEHDSPVEAEPIEEAVAITKPAPRKKPAALVQENSSWYNTPSNVENNPWDGQ